MRAKSIRSALNHDDDSVVLVITDDDDVDDEDDEGNSKLNRDGAGDFDLTLVVASLMVRVCAHALRLSKAMVEILLRNELVQMMRKTRVLR